MLHRQTSLTQGHPSALGARTRRSSRSHQAGVAKIAECSEGEMAGNGMMRLRMKVSK